MLLQTELIFDGSDTGQFLLIVISTPVSFINHTSLITQFRYYFGVTVVSNVLSLMLCQVSDFKRGTICLFPVGAAKWSRTIFHTHH